MASTVPVQNTLNFCATHADLLPLSGVGGYTNEPALSLVNDTLSDLISDGNDWVFNRVEMPSFFTVANKQDYKFAGASVFCITVSPTPSTTSVPSQGWGVDLATNSAITVTGGVVTLNTLETHRFVVGAVLYGNNITMTTGTAANYNSTFTDDGTVSQWNNPIGTVTAVTATSVSWTAQTGQNNGDIGGAPGISNFGYATSASMQEVNNNSSPPNKSTLYVKRELPVSSMVSIIEKVAVMVDYGTGVLQIRMIQVPSWTVYEVKIVYQAKAPVLTTLVGSTWAPFPDNFSAIYRQALIYRMYRYLNSPAADKEYAKLQEEIKKIHGADEGTNTDVGLIPEEPLMGNQYFDAARSELTCHEVKPAVPASSFSKE